MKPPHYQNFTFIDLFAGIGGIRLGMEAAGGRCVFSSEWDEAAQAMYLANFGEQPLGDITAIAAENIPDHDFLTAGFPCQAFSICGDRKGFTDTRGTLFFEIERILAAKQPYGFLLENVRNLTSHDKGRTFNSILHHLKALGYHVHWAILDGRQFGVPQKRERIVIVGFKGKHPFQFPTQSDQPARTLADILEPDSNVAAKYFLSPQAHAKFAAKVPHPPDYLTIWHENKAGHIGIHPFSCALRAGASYNYLTVNGKRRLTPRELLRLQGFPEEFKIVVTDHQLRKQVGNSVVVPKIATVAKAMIWAIQHQAKGEYEQFQLFGEDVSEGKVEVAITCR